MPTSDRGYSPRLSMGANYGLPFNPLKGHPGKPRILKGEGCPDFTHHGFHFRKKQGKALDMFAIQHIIYVTRYGTCYAMRSQTTRRCSVTEGALMSEHEGRVIVITGAAKPDGIGAKTAQTFIENEPDCQVVVLDILDERVK